MSPDRPRRGEVSVRQLHKTYGRLAAVRDVTLDVASGQFFTLLGPSGSGKTTTLMIVAGFVTPDTGSVIIRYQAGHQLLLSWSWVARGTTLHDIIGPQGFVQFGTGGMTVPAEEQGHYQYCCFTDRSGQQTLIKAPAKPDMYTLQAEHFLACIRGEATCQSPGTEAVKAVAVTR